MITPLEIESKEFKRSHRGYDEQEVDEFLDLIIIDFENLIAENKALKEEIAKGSAPKKEANTEKTVYETLEAAKSLMNDIALSAEKRANSLLKNAEIEAELITKEAKENVSKYTSEASRLKERVEQFKDRYKEMLSAEMERLEYFTDDFIRDFESDFLSNKSKEDGKVSVEKIETKEINDLGRTKVVPKIK